MKPSILAVIVAVLGIEVLASGPAVAQEGEIGEIKATTVQHPDGSHTETVKDLSAATGESTTYDAANKITNRVAYKLDANGMEVSGTAFSGKGTALYQFTFSRNAAGQIAEERDLTIKGDLLRRLVYHYDSNNHVSGIDTYDANGNLISGSAKKKTQKSH